MREIRSSGLEGGVEFNPPSLPLFYSRTPPPYLLLFFSGARWTIGDHSPAPEKQKDKGWVGVAFYKQATTQQPAKGALFMGESPIRRIRRFTMERPRVCPCRKAGGVKQSRYRTDGPK